MDTLDYTGPRVNEGSKGVWLGLGDPVRELPREFRRRRAVGHARHRACSVPAVWWSAGRRSPTSRARRPAWRRHPAFADWPLVVLTDEPERAARSAMNFLWTTFTRFEPAADIHAAATTVVRNHLAYRAPIVIDARMKPWFPKEVTCRPDVAEARDARAGASTFRRAVEMGDSERGHLD